MTRMMTVYRYTIEGSAGDDQTWSTSGRVMGLPGEFPELLQEAIRDSFVTLTRGKAVYGRPGIGCSGPYQVTSFKVEIVS